MPTYVYCCSACGIETDVTKPLEYLDAEERCPQCPQSVMSRIISSVKINTSNCRFEAHHNWAFGKVMKSKNDIHNEIKRINGETGKNIIEVGNDAMESIKPQRKEYTLD